MMPRAKLKLVDNVRDWPRWWSVRLSLAGGSILTILESMPHAIATVHSTLPPDIADQIDANILRWIGLICIVASPLARAIEQSKLKR